MDPAALSVLRHVLEARRRGEDEHLDLPGMDLRGAELQRADLVGARLPGAGLDGAQLAGAKLVNADLRETQLCGADLAGADLARADLRGADLSSARIEGADLSGADLRGANLAGVVGEPLALTGARVDHALLERSGLPDQVIVQLWRAGAEIDDLDAFSAAVQHACSAEAAKTKSDAGPPRRRVSEAEMQAVQLKVEQDNEVPPSARVSVEVVEAVLSSMPAPSLRTQKLVASDPAPAMRETPDWRAKDQLMGVTLGQLLGEGNTGQVWSAVDDDGQRVAVKLFSHKRAGFGMSLASYRRGVSVLNRLSGAECEGVVPLISVSLNQLGLVMQLAENGSAVDLPALKWNEASIVDFVKALGRIVERAHGLGVLHRCIKPSNVLLDADLQPMLVDFDMVDLPTLASSKNRAGGYASYAAPEELLGQGSQSPTADIYSLGRILHFLLLGDTPAPEKSDKPALDDIAGRHAGLRRIVRKCCVRAPERRYQTVTELLDDLDNYRDDAKVGLGDRLDDTEPPPRVSGLSHDTPWLGPAAAPRLAPGKPSLAPANRKSQRPPGPAHRGRGMTRAERKAAEAEAQADAQIGLNRAWEKAIGTVGLLIVLGSILAVTASSAPSDQLVTRMRYASTFGGFLAGMLLRRAEESPMLWRLIGMLVIAVALFFLNLPKLMVF